MENRTALAQGAAAALLGTVLLMAAPATQASLIFDLTSDHCTGGCGTAPFGTVLVTQTGANVDITVHLLNGNEFVKTGSADFQAFKFNGVGIVVGDITVGAHTPVLTADTGSLNGNGTGQFSFGIECLSCGNGASDAFADDIVFHVANATIADLTQPNNLGNVFVADIISGQTGNTGPVDASGDGRIPPSENAPLPGTLALLGLGLAGLGFSSRRKQA